MADGKGAYILLHCDYLSEQRLRVASQYMSDVQRALAGLHLTFRARAPIYNSTQSEQY